MNRVTVWLATIKCLQLGKICSVALNQVSQPIQEDASLGGINRAPLAAKFEGFLSSFDGLVNVILCRCGYIANFISRAGVHSGQCFLTTRLNPFIIDEQLREFDIGGSFR